MGGPYSRHKINPKEIYIFMVAIKLMQGKLVIISAIYYT